MQAVARQVPLPDADLPGVGGQLDPFGEALALQLGTLATVDILHLGDEVLGDSSSSRTSDTLMRAQKVSPSWRR
ncbi:hypothetical protein [Pseudomonas aeruginosa]|uniref:hypothetical protein n=1 Tax=Pseudomonas aeruginosa TaxID=287 RepID=UPI0017957790|nr:hypothetical protein [Pseudomonas aeruginosa]MDF5955283.1 hypothetical protein [Pseudomonas aeruginosa]MDW0128837.1 hypothetical protein [Pseudomonas aeruginosa]